MLLHVCTLLLCEYTRYQDIIVYQKLSFLGQGIQIFTQNKLWIKITLLIIVKKVSQQYIYSSANLKQTNITPLIEPELRDQVAFHQDSCAS